MEVYTTEPAMQLYTANFLDGDPKNGGTNNIGRFAWKPALSDSPNHPEFPTTVSIPGKRTRRRPSTSSLPSDVSQFRILISDSDVTDAVPLRV